VHYGQAPSQGFEFYDSVPLAPRAGLIPKRGDILFADATTTWASPWARLGSTDKAKIAPSASGTTLMGDLPT